MKIAADGPRRIGRGVALAVLAVALVAAFFLFDTYPTGSWEGKLVLIPKGSRLPGMIGILRENGILPHPLAFRALGELDGDVVISSSSGWATTPSRSPARRCA